MSKKIIATIIAILFLLTSSFVFAANNEINSSMNKAGDSIKNVVNGAGNIVKDGAGAIGNGINNSANAVRSTVENGANEAQNMGQDAKNHSENMASALTQDNYNVDRTSIEARTTSNAPNNSFLGMNGTTWTWFILGIAALAIIALVWYYAMQNKNSEYDNNNH